MDHRRHKRLHADRQCARKSLSAARLYQGERGYSAESGLSAPRCVDRSK
nr:MAG TPA: hypothetical protein [Caudoviricetes sp.]